MDSPDHQGTVHEPCPTAVGSGKTRTVLQPTEPLVGDAVIMQYVRFRHTTPASWAFDRLQEWSVAGALVVGNDGQPLGYAPLPTCYGTVHCALTEAMMSDVMLPIIQVYDIIPLLHAAAHMVRTGVDHALVRSDEGPIGILTMRGIVSCLVVHHGYRFPGGSCPDLPRLDGDAQ